MIEILVLTIILFNLILYLKCLRSLILLIHSRSLIGKFNDYLIHSKPQTGVIMWVTEEFSLGILEKKSTSITLTVWWRQGDWTTTPNSFFKSFASSWNGMKVLRLNISLTCHAQKKLFHDRVWFQIRFKMITKTNQRREHTKKRVKKLKDRGLMWQ